MVIHMKTFDRGVSGCDKTLMLPYCFSKYFLSFLLLVLSLGYFHVIVILFLPFYAICCNSMEHWSKVVNDETMYVFVVDEY